MRNKDAYESCRQLRKLIKQEKNVKRLRVDSAKSKLKNQLLELYGLLTRMKESKVAKQYRKRGCWGGPVGKYQEINRKKE